MPSLASLPRVALCAAALCAAGGLAAQNPRAALQDFWNNPALVNKFAASYGILSPVEPKLSTEEQELFKKVAEAMRTDANAGLALLRAAVKPDASHGAQVDFALANLAFQAGRVDEALRGWREAIRKFPDFLRAHSNLGIALVQRGEYQAAIPSLAKATELGGGDSVVFGLMGYAYLNLEQLLSAEVAYRNALVFEPANPDWNLGLARTLMEAGKYREAITMLDSIIGTQTNNADLWLYQANAFLATGDTNRAAANYEIVRRMGKLDGAGLVKLGEIYAEAGAHDLAVAAFQEALAKGATLPLGAMVRSAELMISRGGTNQGARLLQQVRTAYRGRLSEAEQIAVTKVEARLAVATGATDAALATLEKVVEANPLDAEALLLLANAYASRGDVDKAEFLFDRASRIRGFEAEALVQQARFLVRQRKYARAVPLLERAQGMRASESVGRFLEQVRTAARSASL